MARQPDDGISLRREIDELKAAVRRLTSRSPFFATGLEPQGDNSTSVIPGADLNVDGNANVSGTLNVGGDTLFGGNVTVVGGANMLIDGGSFTSKSASGVNLLSIGPQTYGDRGLLILRDDGSKAIEIRKVFGASDPTQAMILWDRAGAQIAGDSIVSGNGIGAPHMAIPWTPVDYTSSALAQSTSSATFVATHEHRGFKQNPVFRPQFMVKCSDGTTAGEIQIWSVTAGVYLGGLSGSPAVSTITVPAGTTTFTLFEHASAISLPGGMSADRYYQIHARVTAGTGSITVAPVRSVGQGF